MQQSQAGDSAHAASKAKAFALLSPQRCPQGQKCPQIFTVIARFALGQSVAISCYGELKNNRHPESLGEESSVTELSSKLTGDCHAVIS